MNKASFPAKRLLEFINEEASYPRARLMAFAVLSGIANGVLLAIINHGVGLVGEFSASGDIQVFYLSLFVVGLGLFVYTKKYALDHAAMLVEEVLRRVRMRIADKIRHAELTFIESAGYADIFNCLSQDTIQISQSSSVIFAAIQSGIMVVFAMIYIAWLTPQGFVLTVCALLLGGWVFLSKRDGIIRDLNLATKHELLFFNSFNHTLSGFKEVKINRARSQALFRRQDEIAVEVQMLKSRAGMNAVFVMMFSEVFFYILIAVVLFVWPYVEPTDAAVVVKLTASILFIIGPLNLLFGNLPLFIKADVAVSNLRALESKLDTASRSQQVGESPVRAGLQFEVLRLRDVYFEHIDHEGVAQFSVGPISLEIHRGEIVFIVGGNGSGKSTLLKLVSGLYYPLKGSIEINGEDVDSDMYPDYRELYSIIFTDFHLFDRLYGIPDVDESMVRAWLRKMGMITKTKFRDGRFTNINLSTGQRKRLAYISAMLDDKQVYIFDELAADQDPEFRKHFYQALLPELRDMGKTIIAVTHDDRYFGCADRVLKMDEGRLVVGGIE
ncbi:cyclic peptide export ABC transporter [Propionivibrio sp.]|uniref:cyclic peptide export ABC transporter n=1 Tax=Propionivibrio sp. TaxID=2212460 RepID=UPI003BF267F2